MKGTPLKQSDVGGRLCETVFCPHDGYFFSFIPFDANEEKTGDPSPAFSLSYRIKF